MSPASEHLVFRARALAQAHPLTPLARRFVDRAVAEQRTSQPVPEIGIWAGAAMINGYCLRRVEEDDAAVRLEAGAAEQSLEELEERTGLVAADLRTDDGDRHLLGDAAHTVAALDRMIAGEVDRRLDHWRDSIDERAWAELEEYLTWWVVKGYALRVAETASWAVS